MDDDDIKKALKGKEFVIDAIYEIGDKGKLPEGKVVCALPGDQQMDLNYTTEVGGCTALYYSLVFQMPKWNYKLKKIDEWMSVSPVHTQSYELTVGQKQKLEGMIKQGLASAAQAVADFELARHDLRKYEEIINYFVRAKGMEKDSKGKKKDKDEHVLRSLFIDRVDAYTGENFSMISMTKRWPTIITDFIRMGKLTEDDKKEIDKIKDKLEVSQAEATVLRTKNEMFDSWQKMFLPEVQKRYARIKTLVKAREKSVVEYREWLKPYVARYKMMRDSLEKRPQESVKNVYMAPGFGNAVAVSSIRFLGWIPFNPPEMSKPERTSQISPIDDFSKQWGRYIVKHYKVWGEEQTDKNGNKKTDDDGNPIYDISDENLEKKMEEILKKTTGEKDMVSTVLYYRVFDIKVVKFLGKIPGKGELEDLTFFFKHRTMSQNVLLLHAMELAALEEKFSMHISELIGSKENEEKVRKEVEMRIEGKKEKEVSWQKKWNESFKKTIKPLKSGFSKGSDFFARITQPFIRPGPYESNFEERVTKMYLLPAGQLYSEVIKFLKWKMGVPGAGPSY